MLGVLTYVFIFVLGAAVGSFVNVLIDRTVAGHDWVRGRSHCDHCGRILSWYDLVPIVSYLCYRGTSRCCHKPLSWRYPVVEALVASLFVWWATVGVFFFQLAGRPLTVVQPLFWLGAGVLLAVLAIADWLYGVVLMSVVWVGVVWVVVYRIVLILASAYQTSDFLWGLVAALAAAGFIAALRWMTRGRGMGDGDMYLAFLAGLVVGWPRVIVALLSAFVTGAVVGVVLLATGKKGRHDTIPFGPFLVVGVGVALLFGQSLLHNLYGI